MLLFVALASLVAAAAGAPLVYDQRQDGEFNVAADVQNVVFVVAIPQKMSLPNDIFDDFLKSSKKHNQVSTRAQDRADHAMEAFVEPSTPYRVEIGASDRSAGGDGRAVEVVIASRRRAGPEPLNEDATEEIKLIGATEQCGPDRERDPVTLACRLRAIDTAAPEPQPPKDEVTSVPEQAPEVVPS